MCEDLKNPRLIILKGLLFLVLALACALLVAAEIHSWQGRALLAIGIWAFCRTYYFAFYVLEKYVDPSLRYTGLVDLARGLFVRRRDSLSGRGRKAGQ